MKRGSSSARKRGKLPKRLVDVAGQLGGRACLAGGARKEGEDGQNRGPHTIAEKKGGGEHLRDLLGERPPFRRRSIQIIWGHLDEGGGHAPRCIDRGKTMPVPRTPKTLRRKK